MSSLISQLNEKGYRAETEGILMLLVSSDYISLKSWFILNDSKYPSPGGQL